MAQNWYFRVWPIFAKNQRVHLYLLAKIGILELDLFLQKPKGTALAFGPILVGAYFCQNPKGSLTFWPKVGILELGLFLRKPKGIALLLAKNRYFRTGPIFAKNPRGRPYLLAKNRYFRTGPILPETKEYSFTYWPKIDSFELGRFCQKPKSIALPFGPILVWAYFCQKPKGIALPFGQKSVFSKWANFCQKPKGIALRFGQRSVLTPYVSVAEQT